MIDEPQPSPVLAQSRDIVVVGGGVIGAACAYYLRRAGRNVTLIDQGDFGRGCSHGNCGFVSPSHVLPLAGPGALWPTLRTLAKRNSPLKVRWRLDPALWNWFWRFARRCNQRDMLASARGIQALLNSSRRLYDELLRDTLTEVQWEALGLLFVFQTTHALEHHAAAFRLLHDEFGVDAERHEGESLLKLEPGLQSGLAGAFHYRMDGHLRPDKLMSAWRRALEALGVEILERCALTDLVPQGNRVLRAATTRGELAAEQIVIATGAWTPQLNRLLRHPIPIQPGKGYSLTLPTTTNAPRLPLLFEEHRVAITPLGAAFRIGSTMEFAGYDATLNPDRLRLLRDGARHYLRDPIPEAALESWWGWRPMTPDGLPFIGRVPAYANVFLAAGHGMLGVSMAPATGRLLAELLTEQTPHIEPAPFAVDRSR